MFVFLAVMEEGRDRVVVNDSGLVFHTHIKQTVVHASVIANQTHECFISHDLFAFVQPAKMYVEPVSTFM